MEKRNYTMTNTELLDGFVIDGLPSLQKEQEEEITFSLNEEVLEESLKEESTDSEDNLES